MSPFVRSTIRATRSHVCLLVTRSLAFFCFLTLCYIALHWILPPSANGSLLWSDPPFQWLDWIFWSAAGVLLSASSTLASFTIDPYEGASTVLELTRKFPSELVKGLFIALSTLWIITFVVDLELSGVTIRLKEVPALSVAFAFVFGFYSTVAWRLLVGVLGRASKKYVERLLGRAIVDEADDEGYVTLHVDPKLHQAYLMAASTESGRLGHEASRKRRAGYKVAGFLSKAGFTVNAINTVFIASDVNFKAVCNLAGLVAHEASHIEQRWWSDSLMQEVKAYKSGARVLKELKERGEARCGDEGNWIDLDEEEAKDEVLKLESQAPIYGMIPRNQKTGLADKAEMMRQGVCLGLWQLNAFLGGQEGQGEGMSHVASLVNLVRKSFCTGRGEDE